MSSFSPPKKIKIFHTTTDEQIQEECFFLIMDFLLLLLFSPAQAFEKLQCVLLNVSGNWADLKCQSMLKLIEENARRVVIISSISAEQVMKPAYGEVLIPWF